jgi:predicted nucleic acid-binding protein
MSYWDTSALVKLYMLEPDSAQFQAVTSASVPVVTARIAHYEACTVFLRREVDGLLPPGETPVLLQEISTDIAAGRIIVQEDGLNVEKRFIEVLEQCYSQVPPVFIRTNDALHIASALIAGEAEFVTADLRQRAAAELLGFKILP